MTQTTQLLVWAILVQHSRHGPLPPFLTLPMVVPPLLFATATHPLTNPACSSRPMPVPSSPSNSRHPAPPLHYSAPIAHMSPSYPSYHITPSAVPFASHLHTPFHAMPDQASQAGWSMHSEPSSLSRRGSGVSQLWSELAHLIPICYSSCPSPGHLWFPCIPHPHRHFLPSALSPS